MQVVRACDRTRSLSVRGSVRSDGVERDATIRL